MSNLGASAPFVQATQYEPGHPGRIVNLIVVHTTEGPLESGAALGVAHYFQTITRPASAHYVVDSTEIVHCVQDQDIAWGAPGANEHGLHFEHCGFAHWTAADWQGEAQQAMLRLSARLVAERAKAHNVPIVWLSPQDVAAGKRGITSHWNITRGLHQGTHTDPGANFPIHQYLQLVKEAYAQA